MDEYPHDKKLVGVGIIGAGDIVDRGHIPNFKNNKKCRIISICSKNKKNAQRLQKEYKIPFFDDNYKSLLKREDIDAVSICTPPYTHKEIINESILNNKHILVEKPIAVNLNETKWIINKVEKYSKTFMVSFNNRYREENIWMNKQINSGYIGDIQLADLEWLRTKRDIEKKWLFKKKLAGGGVFADFGVHLLDFVLGHIPDRKTYSVYSYCKDVNPYKSSDVEDMVISIITINNKLIINIKVCWTLSLNVPARVVLKFYGDKGEISNLEYRGKKSDGYKTQVESFIHTIVNKNKVNHKRYLETMILMDAIYKSCKNNAVIKGNF